MKKIMVFCCLFVCFGLAVNAINIIIPWQGFPSEVRQIVRGDKIVGHSYTIEDGNRLIYKSQSGKLYIGDPNKPIAPFRYNLSIDKNRMFF